MAKKYGFSFKGYNAVLDRWLVTPNYITSDSHDVLIDPVQGALARRKGFVRRGAGAPATYLGILEDQWDAKSTQMFSISCPSLEDDTDADNQPTYAAYWSNEDTQQGQLLVRSSSETNSADPTGGANYSYGWEFGTTHYDTAYANYDVSDTSTAFNFHVMPMWYDSGNGGMTRGATKLTRRFLMPGSRRGLDVGRELCMPNYFGTPTRWGKRFNETSNVGTDKNQLYPIGHIPAMGPPTLTDTDTATAGTVVGPWQDGNVFFFSVAFVDQDDAVSMPLLPRDVNAELPDPNGGLCKFKVTSAGDYCEYVTWSNIPLGPPGTKARLLLRTPAAGTAGVPTTISPDISDLRVTAILDNNSQRTYKDYNGNTESLVTDNIRIRYDHRWMPPSRYMWASDHHIIAGDLRPHPGAVVIAPWSSGGIGDLGGDAFTANVFGTSKIFIMRKYNGNIELATSNGTRISDGVPVYDRYQITADNSVDIQYVIDSINATYATSQSAGDAGGWVSQQVPGADATATADNILDTFFTVAGGAALTWTDAAPTVITHTTAGTFNNVAVGMQVSNDANTELDGSYVASVSVGGTVVTLDNTVAPGNTGSGSAAIGFAFNFGDDRYASAEPHAWADKWGWQRCYAPAWPGILYFNNSYLDDFEDDEKSGSRQNRSMIFSGGEPGHAVNAVNNFYVGNKRTGLAEWGRLMGGAPVEIGSLVYYTKAVAKFRNIRGGKTGLDQDFRLESHDERGSCISPYSIAFGNGWAVALERDGLIVRTGAGVSASSSSADRVNISSDVLVRDKIGRYKGAWAAEMNRCVSEADAGGKDYGFRVAVLGSQIHVTYRTDPDDEGSRRRMVYDFTPSVNVSGIRQVLTPDGSPYGWSSPLNQPIVDMVEVTMDDTDTTNSGTAPGQVQIRRFGTTNLNSGSAGDGEIVEFDGIGMETDEGTSYTSEAYMASDFVGAFDLKSVSWAKLLYAKESTGLTLRLSRDRDRSTLDSYGLATTLGTVFKKKTLNVPQLWRIPREIVEFSLFDDGSNDMPWTFWGIEAEIEILDSAGV